MPVAERTLPARGGASFGDAEMERIVVWQGGEPAVGLEEDGQLEGFQADFG